VFARFLRGERGTIKDRPKFSICFGFGAEEHNLNCLGKFHFRQSIGTRHSAKMKLTQTVQIVVIGAETETDTEFRPVFRAQNKFLGSCTQVSGGYVPGNCN